MNQPTEKQLKAIYSLQSNPDFGVFMEWVQESRIVLALLMADFGKEPEKSWAQGKVQQLGLIIKHVADSKINLEALERSNRGG